MEKYETSQNAWRKIYYNLTLQVLSDEYTDYVAKFDAISDFTAEINLELQKAISSNKLKKRRWWGKPWKTANDIFVFKEKKGGFKETEKEIVQSTIIVAKFPLQKTENYYVGPKLQTLLENEDKIEQNKKQYLQTAIGFNKVDLTTHVKIKEKQYFRCSCWFTA